MNNNLEEVFRRAEKVKRRDPGSWLASPGRALQPAGVTLSSSGQLLFNQLMMKKIKEYGFDPEKTEIYIECAINIDYLLLKITAQASENSYLLRFRSRSKVKKNQKPEAFFNHTNLAKRLKHLLPNPQPGRKSSSIALELRRAQAGPPLILVFLLPIKPQER